jgi:hypothetical protein
LALAFRAILNTGKALRARLFGFGFRLFHDRLGLGLLRGPGGFGYVGFGFGRACLFRLNFSFGFLFACLWRLRWRSFRGFGGIGLGPLRGRGGFGYVELGLLRGYSGFGYIGFGLSSLLT